MFQLYIILFYHFCCLGCVTYPIFWIAEGFLAILGVEKITHLFAFAPGDDFWIFLLMSVAYGILSVADCQYFVQFIGLARKIIVAKALTLSRVS